MTYQSGKKNGFQFQPEISFPLAAQITLLPNLKHDVKKALITYRVEMQRYLFK